MAAPFVKTRFVGNVPMPAALPVPVMEVLAADLPNAADYQGCAVFVSDEGKLAVSDGTTWHRFTREGQPYQLPLKTVATAAAVLSTSNIGSMIFVTDDTGGATPAFNATGAAWLRVADRAPIAT